MSVTFWIENGPTKTVPSTELYPNLDASYFCGPHQAFADDGTPVEILPDYPELNLANSNARLVFTMLDIKHDPDGLSGKIAVSAFPALRLKIVSLIYNPESSRRIVITTNGQTRFERVTDDESFVRRIEQLHDLIAYAQARNAPILFG